jgi:hypothetical protein
MLLLIMASLLSIVDNCILIDNFLLLFRVSQPANAFKKVANYIIKLKQTALNTFHIADMRYTVSVIEKNCLLK